MMKKGCCQLTVDVIEELKDLYVHCFYHHLYRKLQTELYNICRECKRVKKLNLRSKYSHSCGKERERLWMLYEKFGNKNITDIIKSNSSFKEITNEFNQWLNGRAEWRPYLTCVKFDRKKYFKSIGKKRKRLENRIKGI